MRIGGSLRGAALVIGSAEVAFTRRNAVGDERAVPRDQQIVQRAGIERRGGDVALCERFLCGGQTNARVRARLNIALCLQHGRVVRVGLSAQLGAVAFAGVNAQAAAVLEDQRASDGGAGNFAAESVQRVALPKGDEKRRIIVELRLRCGDGQCLSVDDGQHAVIVAFSQRGQAHEERDGQRGNGGVARRG